MSRHFLSGSMMQRRGIIMPSGIQYVGGNVGEQIGTDATTAVSLTALTGGIDSAADTNDFVLVNYAKESSSDLTLTANTAGYTKETNPDLYGNDSLDINMAVFSKFMGGTPDTQVIMNNPSVGSGWAGLVLVQVFRGVDLTNPLDVAITTATGGNVGHPNPPSITPITEGARIVICAAAPCQNGSATLSQSGSEQIDFLAAYGDNNDASNNDCTASMGSILWSGAGAVDPVALVGNASNALSWAAACVALRPAA